MVSSNARILVADPDRLQLQLIDMLLAGGRMETTLVDTGKAALEHLKETTPDLCLLALDLPDVAGDVICGKVRRVSRLARVPVVLIAPQAGRFGLSDGARRRARTAGADLILPRPLGDKNLRERLHAILDLRDATPDREGYSTEIIEDALEELPVDLDGADDATPGDGAGPASAGGPSGLDPAGRTPAATDRDDADEPPARADPGDIAAADSTQAAPRRPAETPTADPPRSDDGRGVSAGVRPEEVARLRKELEILRVENAQLKRKLKQKQEQIAENVNPALERTIKDLERRNHALLAELEKYENDTGRGGGPFGRRS